MNIARILKSISQKPSELISVMMAVCLLLLSVTPSFAQAAREDVQLQILMVKSQSRNFDRRGQLLTFQVNDKNGEPVIGAELRQFINEGDTSESQAHSF